MDKQLNDYYILAYGNASHGTVEVYIATVALLKRYNAEIDLKKNKWRVVGLGGPSGMGGRDTPEIWRDMGEKDLSTSTMFMQEDALICVYEKDKFSQIKNMVSVASTALEHD